MVLVEDIKRFEHVEHVIVRGVMKGRTRGSNAMMNDKGTVGRIRSSVRQLVVRQNVLLRRGQRDSANLGWWCW